MTAVTSIEAFFEGAAVGLALGLLLAYVVIPALVDFAAYLSRRHRVR